MTTLKSTDFPSRTLPRPFLDGVRRALRGRRGLIVLGSLALGLGAAFNWSWLVAAGIAPILVAAAPCAVMCALGLCMSRMVGTSCATETTSEKMAEPTAGQTTPVVSETAAAIAPVNQSQVQDERRLTDA